MTLSIMALYVVVVMLSVTCKPFMLNVVRLNVVMLIVTSPKIPYLSFKPSKSKK